MSSRATNAWGTKHKQTMMVDKEVSHGKYCFVAALEAALLFSAVMNADEESLGLGECPLHSLQWHVLDTTVIA
jgi:hypothetical protein